MESSERRQGQSTATAMQTFYKAPPQFLFQRQGGTQSKTSALRAMFIQAITFDNKARQQSTQ